MKFTLLFFTIILFLSIQTASAVDWYSDDCYKIFDEIYSNENITVFTNLTLGSGDVNYSVMFNQTEVCRYDYAYNGTVPCIVDTVLLLGNYSILCNLTDGSSILEVSDGWINILGTTTTTTTTVSTTSSTIVYGNLTLILSNDSFNYNLCYDNLNSCYGKSESKLIDKDYMMYIIPQQESILDYNYIIFFLTIALFASAIIMFLVIMFSLLIFVGGMVFK
jgi:hypothetical protein